MNHHKPIIKQRYSPYGQQSSLPHCFTSLIPNRFGIVVLRKSLLHSGEHSCWIHPLIILFKIKGVDLQPNLYSYKLLVPRLKCYKHLYLGQTIISTKIGPRKMKVQKTSLQKTELELTWINMISVQTPV